MKRYEAIYARQSIDKKDSLSIETQIRECKKKCKNKKTVKVYSDKGFSGKNTDRPQLQLLINDIKSGIISKVFVYKVDRISRDVADFYTLWKMMDESNCQIVSSQEPIDTTTTYGRGMMGILAIFAQMERENLINRVNDNIAYRMTAHRRVSGSAPFGYKGVKKNNIATLEPKEDEIEIIQYMFKTYASDLNVSMGKLRDKLIEKGFTNKNGNNITPQGVRLILTNPVYAKADRILLNYYQKLGYEIVNAPNEWNGKCSACLMYRNKTDVKKVVYITDIKPIISSRLFIQVQERISTNKSFCSSNTPNNKLKELSGLIKCSECNNAVKMMNKQNLFCAGRVKKRCTASYKGITLEKIQSKVDTEITTRLQELKDTIDIKIRKRQNDIKQIDKLQKQLDNLLDVVASCEDEVPDSLKIKVRELTTKLKDKQLKLDTDNSQDIIELRLQSVLGDKIFKSMYDVRGHLIFNYAEASTDIKQMILRVLVEKIVLNTDGSIDIIYKEESVK